MLQASTFPIRGLPQQILKSDTFSAVERLKETFTVSQIDRSRQNRLKCNKTESIGSL